MENHRPQEKIEAAMRLIKSAILDGADSDEVAEQCEEAINWALDELDGHN